MKIRTIIVSCLISIALCLFAVSDPAPYSVTIDSFAASLPAVSVFQGNGKTIRTSFFDNGSVANLTNCTPYMKWATSNTSANVYTGGYSFVTSPTNGIVDFSFTSSQLNTNGHFVYEIGVTDSKTSKVTYGQGLFKIVKAL